MSQRMMWIIYKNWLSGATYCFPSYFANENLTGEGHSVNIRCNLELVKTDDDGIYVLFRALDGGTCSDLYLNMDTKQGRDLPTV